MKMDTKQPMASGNTPTPSNITRSSKKPKKRHTHRKPSRTISETSTLETGSSSYREDDTAMSGTDSLEDSRSKKSLELLEEGCVISLRARDRSVLHISRQRGQGGGWFLDTVSTVTRRDPATQFLVEFRKKDTIGLRSFTAGGKLLQINNQMEFVFASPSFDTWESWTYEGSLEECRLVNPRYPSAVLSVRVEILATVGDDGITRWHD